MSISLHLGSVTFGCITVFVNRLLSPCLRRVSEESIPPVCSNLKLNLLGDKQALSMEELIVINFG